MFLVTIARLHRFPVLDDNLVQLALSDTENSILSATIRLVKTFFERSRHFQQGVDSAMRSSWEWQDHP